MRLSVLGVELEVRAVGPVLEGEEEEEARHLVAWVVLEQVVDAAGMAL